MSGRFVFLAEDYDEIYRKCKDAEQSYRNGKFDDCREQTCNLIKDIFANMGMTLFEALNIKKYDYISDSLKSIIYLSNSLFILANSVTNPVDLSSISPYGF